MKMELKEFVATTISEYLNEQNINDFENDFVLLKKQDSSIRNDVNHYSFIIFDKKRNQNVGNISLNYRNDLGGYQMENIKTLGGTGIGYETYKILINSLDKPLISDSSRSEGAEHMWIKLEKKWAC